MHMTSLISFERSVETLDRELVSALLIEGKRLIAHARLCHALANELNPNRCGFGS